MSLRENANKIMSAALRAAMPDTAVRAALENADFSQGRLVLVAAGKAGWQMASAAWDQLGSRISGGLGRAGCLGSVASWWLSSCGG